MSKDARQRVPKYVTIKCPKCGKDTKGMGFWMTRVYYLHKYQGMTPDEIYEALPHAPPWRGITLRYIRELIDDVVTTCQHCQEILVPTDKEREILHLRGRGVTLSQIHDLSGWSVYKIRKTIAKWESRSMTTGPLRRGVFPAGWFGTW